LRLFGVPPTFVGLAAPVVVPGLRLDGTDPGIEFDPDLVYRFRPGELVAGRFPIGETGFAPPTLRIPPGETGFRVACLGDSCTFGVGAGPAAAYPSLLAKALSVAFRDGAADVVNAGRPGYSSEQSLALLRRDVLPLRPSVVVAYLGANNDFVRVSRLTDQEVLERLARPWVRAATSSNLVRFLLRSLARTRGEWEPSPAHRERVPLPRFEEVLEEVVRVTRSAGAEAVLVVPPFAPEKRAQIPECLAYAEAVRRVAARLDVPLLDVTEEFAAFDAYSLFLFAEPIHPNANGHRLIAARLYDVLVTDSRLASAFDRAGAREIREFEALAARSEREAVPSHPRAALSDRSEVPLARAFRSIAAGDAAAAARDLVEASLTHPYRPGVRRFLALVEAFRLEEVGKRTAYGQFEAIGDHVCDSDPLEAALRAWESPHPDTFGDLDSPSLREAAALLLHRDRALGGGARFDRRVPRAFALAAQNRLEEAEDLLEAVLETNPNEPAALHLLGVHRSSQGKPDLAESLFERAVNARPDDWQSRLSLARLLANRGERARAVAELGEILHEFPAAEQARELLRELAPERSPR
jgi:lysophospholipase L1-like esterase